MRGFEAILDAHLYSVSAQTLGVSGMNITLGLNPGPAVRPQRPLLFLNENVSEMGLASLRDRM